MNHRIIRLAATVACLFAFGFEGAAAGGAPLTVFVSIEPQRYFVERIGGERVAVAVLVPAGADPHTWEPKPRVMAALSRAAVYFSVGIDFEAAWMEKIAAANPAMRIVPTDRGIEKIPLPAHDDLKTPAREADAGRTRAQGGKRPAHDHAHKHGHAPGEGLDPHIWLSPALVRVQAGHIRDGLIAVDPEHRARYEAGHAAFLEEIDALDAELRALFAGKEGSRFLVFHPSWGYFARDYGLEQRAIEIEPQSVLFNNAMGDVYLAEKDANVALVYYRKALEKDPQYALAHSGMGDAHRLLGDAAAAEASYRKALALRPDYHLVYFKLGELYEKTQPAEAIKHFEKYLASGKNLALEKAARERLAILRPVAEVQQIQ